MPSDSRGGFLEGARQRRPKAVKWARSSINYQTFGFVFSVLALGLALAGEASGYEYAAGDVTLPFAYSVAVSSAPRPKNLDYLDNRYPDNCQAIVRMDGELWSFQSRFGMSLTGYGPFPPHARYAGPDIDHMTRREDSSFPAGYHLAWILGGLWYDEVEHKLYAPMHIEAEGIDRDGPSAPWPARKIILATSMDKGKTWKDEGDIIVPETYFGISDVYKFSGSHCSNGLSDYGFFADTRGGYFYIFAQESWLKKGTYEGCWSTRVARCSIRDKMAPGKWSFFCDGIWDQPALGGRSSVVAPAQIWSCIYNSYLEKYICLFFSSDQLAGLEHTDGVYMGFCTDLSKQDWKWNYFPDDKQILRTLINEDGTDISTCGRTLRLYCYGDGNAYQHLDITFGQGTTVGSTEQPRYSFDSHPESSDRIQSRRTKFVGSQSGDSHYVGAWSDRSNPNSYQGHFRECGSAGSVELTFWGEDVFWRALCSPNSGRADVYVDGTLRKTVDCFSPQSNDYEQIVYMITGLAPERTHTIRVVIHNDKNPRSTGTAVRHIGFEYAAESYRASAGFSSLMGNNNWFYREGKGSVHQDLHFWESVGVMANYWTGEGESSIGPDYQVVGESEVIREWVAPHGGSVRVEGSAAVSPKLHRGVRVGIDKNQTRVWPSQIIGPGTEATHDFTVDVAQGDSIRFVASRESGAPAYEPDAARVTWNPVVTYIGKASPAVWKLNPPSGRNLAFGKYARSRRLWHGYLPSSAVDGSIDTNFTISDLDEISTGDDWLMVDLNEILQVDRYVVLSVPPNPLWRPKSFALQISDNGFLWTDVDRVIDNTHDRVERPVTPFKARYVRLYLPDGKPFSINEFELYYTGGAAVSDSSARLNLR